MKALGVVLLVVVLVAALAKDLKAENLRQTANAAVTVVLILMVVEVIRWALEVWS